MKGPRAREQHSGLDSGLDFRADSGREQREMGLEGKEKDTLVNKFHARQGLHAFDFHQPYS